MTCRFSILLHHSLLLASPHWLLILGQLLKSSSAMQPLYEPFFQAGRKPTWVAFSFLAHLYSSVSFLKRFFLTTFFKYNPYLHSKNYHSAWLFSPQIHLSSPDLLNNVLSINFLFSSTIMGEIRAGFFFLFCSSLSSQSLEHDIAQSKSTINMCWDRNGFGILIDTVLQ